MSELLQAVAQLQAFVADHVGQNESCASALALVRVDQNLATAVERLINEPVCDPEVLLGVLLGLVVQLQVEVLEEFITLRVRLAGNIQNVGHTSFNQITRLERTLERSHVDPLVHLDQADIPEVNIAGAEVHVREATAGHLLQLTCVLLTVIFMASARLLLVDGRPTEPRVPLDLLLLELGDRDGHRLLLLALHALVELLGSDLLLASLVSLLLLAYFFLVLVHLYKVTDSDFYNSDYFLI